MESQLLSSNGHQLAVGLDHPPHRVVSLVPSMTESLFTLGLGSSLVGCTDYCVRPADLVASLKRVGGTKNPRLADIQALNPDLIIANQEENTQVVVQELKSTGFPVWVTFPKTVRTALDDLWQLVGVYRNKLAALQLDSLERAIVWAHSASQEGARTRYFCPIWFETTDAEIPWWMTFNRDTYARDILSLVGGENVFDNRERHYPLQADLSLAQAEDPGDRDTRYPRVVVHEILAAAPEVILLPDEPFEFGEAHRESLLQICADTPAVKNGRVYLIDGSLITWHGTRVAEALRVLPSLLAEGSP